MENRKDFGDLFVKRTEDLGGFDIYLKVDDGVKKLCFFNEAGMEALKDWIIESLEDDGFKSRKLDTDIKRLIYDFESGNDTRVTNIKWQPRKCIEGLSKMGPIELEMTFEHIRD